jgi:hypothetical protein
MKPSIFYGFATSSNTRESAGCANTGDRVVDVARGLLKPRAITWRKSRCVRICLILFLPDRKSDMERLIVWTTIEMNRAEHEKYILFLNKKIDDCY